MQREVITVGPEAKIEQIAKILIDNKISGVPVVDATDKIIGIVTEGDLLHKQITPKTPMINTFLGGLAYTKEFEQYNSNLQKLAALTAEEIMTTTLAIVSEDTPVKEISNIMVNKNINRVPVVTHGILVGIVTRADVLKTIA